jgi:hypothetical protein
MNINDSEETRYLTDFTSYHVSSEISFLFSKTIPVLYNIQSVREIYSQFMGDTDVKFTVYTKCFTEHSTLRTF